ncbi:hypothetical protein NE237_028350 [Protea cynaroides]|uniref:RBR-type E3 ubiquitin transferase n=1 Tax=Protea cynaroides TaxID=273540 RepID=A0A9Q0GRV4_9MAGN|nr:hypothetical protein NE237_028350 [Protea cynaroides]
MAESSIAHCDECVDDFYFSVLTNENEILPISDENYAQELQFQEVLTSSLISFNLAAAAAASVAAEAKTAAAAAESSSRKEKETLVSLLQNSPSKSKIQKQVGESSHSFCEICMEGKQAGEMFRNKMICSHSYCRECIAKHVASKIQENVNTVKCPDLNCKAVLEPSQCRAIIPGEVFDRWSSSMCESLVLGSSRFYCPFKDCSGVMLVEDGKERPIVTQSECPYCRRLFCAQCKVPWHSEIACEMFQKLEKNDTGREDLMAIELANKLKWKRCPQCNFFVEKREGCLHIACRCGFHFCYGCGKKYTDTHASCQ